MSNFLNACEILFTFILAANVITDTFMKLNLYGRELRKAKTALKIWLSAFIKIETNYMMHKTVTVLRGGNTEKLLYFALIYSPIF